MDPALPARSPTTDGQGQARTARDDALRLRDQGIPPPDQAPSRRREPPLTSSAIRLAKAGKHKDAIAAFQQARQEPHAQGPGPAPGRPELRGRRGLEARRAELPGRPQGRRRRRLTPPERPPLPARPRRRGAGQHRRSPRSTTTRSPPTTTATSTSPSGSAGWREWHPRLRFTEGSQGR